MQRPTPVDEEVTFDSGVIISETDLDGIITYANRKFAEISGYSQSELKGQPHSILRHPDMPKAAFEDMWSTIKNEEEWNGFVKNLRKDGKYYWVKTFVKPSYDKEGNLKGYIAARKIPRRDEIMAASKQYASDRALER
ncbi:MAG: PAS domain-containing protein [Campylobacterota bacterium]